MATKDNDNVMMELRDFILTMEFEKAMEDLVADPAFNEIVNYRTNDFIRRHGKTPVEVLPYIEADPQELSDKFRQQVASDTSICNKENTIVGGIESGLTTLRRLGQRAIDLTVVNFQPLPATANLNDISASTVSDTGTISLMDYFGAERLATDLPWATAHIDITRSRRTDDASVMFLARVGVNRRQEHVAAYKHKLEITIVIGDQEAKTTLAPTVNYRTIGRFKLSEIQLLWLDIIE